MEEGWNRLEVSKPVHLPLRETGPALQPSCESEVLPVSLPKQGKDFE